LDIKTVGIELAAEVYHRINVRNGIMGRALAGMVIGRHLAALMSRIFQEILGNLIVALKGLGKNSRKEQTQDKNQLGY
jgi:hypothetical protein